MPLSAAIALAIAVMAFFALVVGLVHDLRPDLWTSRRGRRQRRRERGRTLIPALAAPAPLPIVRPAALSPADDRVSAGTDLADPGVEPVSGTAVDGRLTPSLEAQRPPRDPASLTPLEIFGSASPLRPRAVPAGTGAGTTALLERPATAPATAHTPREGLYFREWVDPELSSAAPEGVTRPAQMPQPAASDARPAQTAPAPRSAGPRSQPAATRSRVVRRRRTNRNLAMVAGCAVAAWIILS